jgi:glutathione S-transferase
MVPALRTPTGDILTENAAILPFIADQFPAANLAPAAGIERSRLAQWLSFIGSELHKTVFTPLLSPKANDGAKTYAREAAPRGWPISTPICRAATTCWTASASPTPTSPPCSTGPSSSAST